MIAGSGKSRKRPAPCSPILPPRTGQPVSRERLADLLWPYQGSEQARHSLRNCLLELRKALGPGTDAHLVADFANCRIQDAIVDLDRFRAAVPLAEAVSSCRAAAELYRGEFLADFDINSEPFQEWLAAERDRTLAMVCDVLHRLSGSRTRLASTRPQSSRAPAGRARPLSEFGQRALMRAYARAGRRGEALRQYKSCAETLKRELGVAPDVETQSLANEISRSSGAREHNLDRTPERRIAISARGLIAPDRLPGARTPAQIDAPSPARQNRAGLVCCRTLPWPSRRCAILTGDPDQQYLVEAFTDDLVTDLLRHGRGLSLKPLRRRAWCRWQRQPDVRTRRTITSSPAAPKPARPGCCGSTCGSPMRRPRNTSGRAGMNSSRKTLLRSRRGSPDGFRANFTSCCFKQRAAGLWLHRVWISGSPSVSPRRRMR